MFPVTGFVFLLTFILSALFTLILMEFGLLTALMTVFTFYLVELSYTLTRILEPVGNWQFWLPHHPWCSPGPEAISASASSVTCRMEVVPGGKQHAAGHRKSPKRKRVGKDNICAVPSPYLGNMMLLKQSKVNWRHGSPRETNA